MRCVALFSNHVFRGRCYAPRSNMVSIYLLRVRRAAAFHKIFRRTTYLRNDYENGFKNNK